MPVTESDTRALRSKAVELQARREHSAAELQQKLITKGYDATGVQQIIAELQQQGLICDERFAEAFARYRAERGHGPMRIVAELRERGVNETVVAGAVDQRDPDWIERARQVRSKRFGEELPAEFGERGRQSRFLQYRGFTSDQIRHAMEQDN